MPDSRTGQRNRGSNGTVEDGSVPAALSAEQVADRAGVSVGTLKRWVKAGAIPQYDGAWTPAASAHARIVAQLRRGGQPLDEIVKAASDGRLVLGGVDNLFVGETNTHTLRQAAKAAGVKPEVAEQIWVALGFSMESQNHVSELDLEALRRVAEILDAGVPLAAMLQVIRVSAKAFADIADAEARLIRMFEHEPLLQDGAASDEISEVMGEMITAVLPHLSPLMEFIHNRYLQQYTEQVQIENVQAGVPDGRGLLDTAVCFVDIAGFTRYTEQAGVEKAFQQAEALRDHIQQTLPDSARLIKLTGDGAMIVGSEPAELARWAVEIAEEEDKTFSLRVGLHLGETLYRDGDYFGGAVNMAARVLNRADRDEVLVTDQVKSAIRNPASAGLRFVSIGQVRLKGFDDSVELFRIELRGDR